MSDNDELAHRLQQLEEAERELQNAQRRYSALRSLVAALQELQSLEGEEQAGASASGFTGPWSPPVAVQATDFGFKGPPAGFPRGREAVKAILAERGMEMEQRQIFGVMESKGWVDSTLKDAFASLRVTLRRMWQAGELEKPRNGVYRLPVEQPSSDEPKQTLTFSLDEAADA